MHREWNRTWSALNCIDSAAILLYARRLCNFLCRVINDRCNPIVTPTHANKIHASMFRLARAAMKNSARCVICRELLQSATRYVFQLISCNLDKWMLVCVGANYRDLVKNAVCTVRIRDACHLNIAAMFDSEWQIGASAILRFLVWTHTSMYLHIYINARIYHLLDLFIRTFRTSWMLRTVSIWLSVCNCRFCACGTFVNIS